MSQAGEELETVCPKCEGKGHTYGDNYDDNPRGPHRVYDCSDCGGAGFHATPLGDRIVALIKHQFRGLVPREDEF